jgi:hypothetical protein
VGTPPRRGWLAEAVPTADGHVVLCLDLAVGGMAQLWRSCGDWRVELTYIVIMWFC